jgi:hypothetical protein
LQHRRRWRAEIYRRVMFSILDGRRATHARPFDARTSMPAYEGGPPTVEQ